MKYASQPSTTGVIPSTRLLYQRERRSISFWNIPGIYEEGWSCFCVWETTWRLWRAPNISAIARECSTSTWFVRKIESELREFGRVLKEDEMPKRREGPIGPCSKSTTTTCLYSINCILTNQAEHVLAIFSGSSTSHNRSTRFKHKGHIISQNFLTNYTLPLLIHIHTSPLHTN